MPNTREQAAAPPHPQAPLSTLARLRHWRPRLMAVSLWLMALVTLCLGATAWIAIPLLGDIAHKSVQTRDVHIPTIVETQRNAIKLEDLGRYVSNVFWSRDARTERDNRLEAQVLVQGIQLDQDEELSRGTATILDGIQQLIRIRTEQRGLEDSIRSHAESLHDYWLQVSRELTAPLPELDKVLQQLPLQAIHLTALDPHIEDLLKEVHQTEITLASQNLDEVSRSALQRQLQALDTLLSREMLLDSHARDVFAEVLDTQRRLSNHLTTDAAFKAKQVAEDVRADAQLLQRYSLLLFAVLLVGTVIAFFTLHRLVLRPIQMALGGLRSVQHHHAAIRLPRVRFHELDTICRAVEEYGDLTNRLRTANTELRTLSQSDGLTGLANRRSFDAQLKAEFNRAHRHGHGLALVMIDVDHFKQLNDQQGHLTGDDCLRALAEVLLHYTQRTGELAARYGGEEFALILPQLTHQEVIALAEDIRGEIEQLASVRNEQGLTVHFTVSAGIVHSPRGRDIASVEQLISRADKALYQAKRNGRNRVEIYSIGMGSDSQTLGQV